MERIWIVSRRKCRNFGRLYSAVMNSGHIPFVCLLLLYTPTCSSLHSSALFRLSMLGKCHPHLRGLSTPRGLNRPWDTQSRKSMKTCSNFYKLKGTLLNWYALSSVNFYSEVSRRIKRSICVDICWWNYFTWRKLLNFCEIGVPFEANQISPFRPGARSTESTTDRVEMAISGDVNG